MTSRPAVELLHGAVRVEHERGGWVRPWRFSADQVRAFGSCQAWHPGLFRQMARTTSGITVEFVTDSSEVALQIVMDGEPTGTRDILDYTVGESPEERRPHDGVSADVDGRHLGVRMPEDDSDFVGFSLDDPDAAPSDGLLQLPGFGDVHRVRLHLPCLRGCVLGKVVGNGSYLEAIPARRQLLVLSDSIAQGFTVDDPAFAWPRLLADELDLDLINQGLGGQVFQPGSLYGLAGAIDPERIVVQLGTNYRFEPCRDRAVTRDIRSFLLEVCRIWPQMPTWVLTPLWFDEESYGAHPMSCWKQVDTFIRAHTAPHDQMTLVDGKALLEHKTSLFSDIYGHPNARGARQVAGRLSVIMQAVGNSAEGREMALKALRRAPRRTFPLVEALRRGIGEVVFARKGCVLTRLPDGEMLFWASDYELGRTVIATLVDSDTVFVLEPGLVRDFTVLRGLTSITPNHPCVYPSKEPLPVDPSFDIRPLGEEWLQVVRTCYSHPEFQTDAQVRGLLRAGLILGGFEGEELVGFVGEHPGGSMGMLEVFPDYRRRGWAKALESAKINQHLSFGWTPWCEVFPDNKASLKLQRKLGLKVTPSNEQCYLSLPDESEVALASVAPSAQQEDEAAERALQVQNAPDSLGRLAQELGIDLLEDISLPAARQETEA